MAEREKRPAHRPPKYPGEPMTTVTVRLPVRLKEKLSRLSGGRSGSWICSRVEEAEELERIDACGAPARSVS